MSTLYSRKGHHCAAYKCYVWLPRKNRLCRKHWERLPAELQAGVRQAWNDGKPLTSYTAVDAFTLLWLRQEREIRHYLGDNP